MIDASKITAMTKKPVMIGLNERGTARVRFAGSINLFGVDEDGQAVLLEMLEGSGVRKITVAGFQELRAEARSLPASIGTVVTSGPKAEVPSDEAPPAPVQGSNILQKMRDEFRRNLGVTREFFLESDTELPGYEIPDDAGDLFEEDEAAIRKAQKAEAAKKAKEERNQKEKSSAEENNQKVNSVGFEEGKADAESSGSSDSE